MRAHVVHIEHNTKHNIVFLEDLSTTTGSVSITNDAEAVVDYYRAIYGDRVRIVYKDTDNEWWEIVWQIRNRGGNYVAFKPWHGMMWDQLSKVQ